MARPAAAGAARLLPLALVALASRLPTLGNPVLHVDEEFYFVTAWRMWHGALPFVDVWDRKPIGLFLLFTPAAWLPLPWGTYAYQLMALAAVIGTAWLIRRLAAAAGWRRGAALGAIAYILWLDLLGGMGGQSPVWFNLPMTLAGLLVATADRHRHRRRRGAAAMALVGCCLQIKYSVVFEGMFFGLWLLAGEWRATRSPAAIVAYGAALVALALLPTAAAFGVYAALGHEGAFVFANFTSIMARGPDPWREALGNAATLVLILSPLIAMAFGARGEATGGDPRVRAFLFAWLGAAIGGVALFGGWFDHYGLPVLVPGTACAAGFLGGTRWRRRIAPAVLMLAALAGQITMAVNRAHRGTPAQFASLARAVGRGPGCLYVYSGTTMLYPATGRCALSAYLFPSHLGRIRERGAIGVDQQQEVRRILAAAPAVIVMRPPYTGERPEVRTLVEDAISRRYRLRAGRPMGNERIAIYTPR